MSAKAKAVGPSSSEVAAGQVANSQYGRWKEKYSPLLVKRGETTQLDTVDKVTSGRAGADTMQALAKAPSIVQTESVDGTGDIGRARTGQLGVAHANAVKVQNDEGTSVLAHGQQLAGYASQGLQMAGSMEANKNIELAKGKQAERQSIYNAGAQIAGSFASNMYENAKNSGIAATGKLDAAPNWNDVFTNRVVTGADQNGVSTFSTVSPLQALWEKFAKSGKG
jgi:hypothetical protein